MNKLFLSLAILSTSLTAFAHEPSDKDCCKSAKAPCCGEKCCKAGDECCKPHAHKACPKECKETPAAPKG